MATVAGLPVEFGMYTVLLPMAVYAVLGTSRRLSMSTTATIGILTGAVLTEVVHAGTPEQMAAATATVTLMVGAALLLGSILRLGNIANFISDPVLIGFKVGLGFVIAADQAPKIFGVHYAKVGFFRDLRSLWLHLPETSAPTLLFAGITLALIFAMEHFWPKAPAALVAVVGGIVASGTLGLQQMGLAVVGHVPAGLPGLHVPGPVEIGALWPAAIGIALMSFTETIAVGRAFALPGEPRPVPDQELRAIGLANVLGSMFHAMPAGGGTTQTAVNCQSGARTQIAELVTAGLAVLAALFLAPPIGLMPQATLAAVVIATSAGLVSPKELIAIRQVRHMEFWWGISAAAGVILLGTLHGILAAVIISMGALIHETNRAPVYALGRKPGTSIFRPKSPEHPGDETFPGLLLMRTEGRMYFANAQSVGDRLSAMIHEAKPQVLVLDCSAVPDFEYTALRMLIHAEEKLRGEGVMLWLAGLTPLALDLIRRSALGGVLGRERMCFDVAEAVTRFQGLHAARV
jgi:high affinity sulfate transporter 1